MKQSEIKALGLEEMSQAELKFVQGGTPWRTVWKVVKWLGEAIGAAIVGHAVESAIDDAEVAEDDIYDAVYFGGTLDAAYCYADK